MSTPGTFDYQLSAAEEQRARKLHQESIVFDLLCQHAGGNIFDHFPKDIQDEFYEQGEERRCRSRSLHLGRVLPV